MGIDDFRRLSNSRTTGFENAKYENVAVPNHVYDIEAKIEQWMKNHSDQKFLKSIYVSEDLDVESRVIGCCLKRMEHVDRWNPEASGNRVYLNPWYDN